MAMQSLNDSSSRKDSTEFIEYRQNTLASIIEEAKIRGDIIDENYLLYHMRLKGIENYTRSKLYQDRLALDSKNNYIRDFLPRYSQVQQDIFNKLDEYEKQLDGMMAEPLTIQKRMVRDTKDGTMVTVITEDHTVQNIRECIKIGVKIQELKQKHCEGQNIQIAAVIVQKELNNKKIQLLKQSEEIKKLSVAVTKNEGKQLQT